MNRKKTYWKVFGLILPAVLSFVAIWYYSQNITIKNVQLSSPYNNAFQEEINIELDKPAALYIKYWVDGSAEKISNFTISQRIKTQYSIIAA
jgi:hypothetical protein